MKMANGTIVLVVDGARMLLLKNRGDETYCDLRVIEHAAIDNPPSREQMSDAPGIVFQSMGSGKSTYEEANPHQQNKDRFAMGAAEALEKVAAEGDGDIVIVAPPDILGALRPHLGPAVKKRLLAEIDKDLTKMPVREIEALLSSERI